MARKKEPIQTSMPSDLLILQRRVAEAYWRWKVWKQLFMKARGDRGEAKERLRVMNGMASDFFGMIHELLFSDIVVRICKLGDPRESNTPQGKRSNLTLEKLFNDADSRLSKAKKVRARKLLDRFKTDTTFFRLWRNRKEAHEDHLTATRIDLLPAIKLRSIDRVLKSAATILRVLDPAAPACEFAYDQMIAFGDGESMMFALRCAERYVLECREHGKRPLAGVIVRKNGSS